VINSTSLSGSLAILSTNQTVANGSLWSVILVFGVRRRRQAAQSRLGAA
jgi:hypothetical protein